VPGVLWGFLRRFIMDMDSATACHVVEPLSECSFRPSVSSGACRS